ncbi:MAG: methyl-accepting chemotaxis protein [Bacillota bacterium]
MRFNDLQLRTKLYLALAVPVTVCVILVTQAHLSRNALQGTIVNLGTRHLQSVSLLLNIDRDLYQSLQGVQNSLTTTGEKRKAWVEAARSNFAQVEERWGQYKSIATADMPEKCAAFEAACKEYKGLFEPVVAVGDDYASSPANMTAFDKVAAQFELTRAVVSEISDAEEESAGETSAASLVAVGSVNRQQIVISVAGVLISILGSALLYNRIAGSAKRTLARVRDISRGDGDLTRRLKVDSKDELGQLASEINGFLDSLHGIIEQILASADRVTGICQELNASADQAGKMSRQVAAAVEQVAKGASDQSRITAELLSGANSFMTAADSVSSGSIEQSSTIEEARKAVDRMVEAARAAGESVEKITGLMALTAEAAANGTAAVAETQESMEQLSHSTGEVSDCISELGKRSEEIGNIVEVIRDIADQTNLLALNAAIEAARAGEHGRGFAVVADEVRKLAENAAQSTRQISDLIAKVNGGIETAVRGSGGNQDRIGAVLAVGRRSAEVLSSISEHVRSTTAEINRLSDLAPELLQRGSNLSEAVAGIAAVAGRNAEAATVMRSDSQGVVEGIRGISDLSQRAAAVAEEVSASAEEQSAGAEQVAAAAGRARASIDELRSLVARFKLA